MALVPVLALNWTNVWNFDAVFGGDHVSLTNLRQAHTLNRLFREH